MELRISGQVSASAIKLCILDTVVFLRSCSCQEQQVPRSDCSCDVWCHTFCFTLLSKLDQLGKYKCGTSGKQLVLNGVSESSHLCGSVLKHAVPDASLWQCIAVLAYSLERLNSPINGKAISNTVNTTSAHALWIKLVLKWSYVTSFPGCATYGNGIFQGRCSRSSEGFK